MCVFNLGNSLRHVLKSQGMEMLSDAQRHPPPSVGSSPTHLSAQSLDVMLKCGVHSL